MRAPDAPAHRGRLQQAQGGAVLRGTGNSRSKDSQQGCTKSGCRKRWWKSRGLLPPGCRNGPGRNVSSIVIGDDPRVRATAGGWACRRKGDGQLARPKGEG